MRLCVALLFVVALAAAPVAGQTDTSGVCKSNSCMTHDDCRECYKPIVGNTLIQPHDVFVRPGFIEIFEAKNRFICSASGFCELDLTSSDSVATFPELLTQCNVVSRSACLIANTFFLPSTIEPVCQAKRCTLYADFDKIGFCIYNDESFAINKECCVDDVDCPLDVTTGAADPCNRPSCVANKCLLDVLKGNKCCSGSIQCQGLPLLELPNGFSLPDQDAVAGFCAQEPGNTGKCTAIIPVDASCVADADCGGDGVGNACAVGRCIGGQCSISPRPIANAGCCTFDADPLCSTTNVCLVYQGCANTVQTVIGNAGDSMTILPTFQCEYDDLRELGCCNGNNECAELAAVSGCVSPVCNGEEKRCVLNDGNRFDRAPCAYSSAGCPAQFANFDQCQFFASVGNPRSEIETNYFRCNLQTTGLCGAPDASAATDPQTGDPFRSYPAGGLVPQLTIVRTELDCAYECPGERQNSARVSYRISNPSTDDDDDYPLHFYNVQLVTLSDTLTRIVDDIELVGGRFIQGSPAGTLYPPEFDVDSELQPGSLQDTSSFFGYSVRRRFRGQEYRAIPIYPDAVLELEFEVLFTPDQNVGSISSVLTVEPIDLCLPFYYGREPGCSGPGDLFDPIFRDGQAGAIEPLTQFGAGPNNCSPPCFVGVSTTTGTITPAPTPSAAPTPSPTPVPPTPAPPTEMTPLAVNAFYTLSVALISCSFDCSAPIDGMLNSIMVEFAQTADRGRGGFFGLAAFAANITLERQGGQIVQFRSIASPVVLHDESPFSSQGQLFIPFVDPGALSAFGVNSTTSLPLIKVTGDGDEFEAGDEYRAKLSFFYDATSAFDDYVTGSIVLTAYDSAYECDALGVSLGVCSPLELGNTVTLITELPPLQLEFGTGTGQCSQRCPLPATVPDPVVCTTRVEPRCDYDCGDATQIINQQNRYFANICVDYLSPDTGNTLPIVLQEFKLRVDNVFDFLVLRDGAYLEFANGTRIAPTSVTAAIDYVWDFPDVVLTAGQSFCFEISIALDSLKLPTETIRDAIFGLFQPIVAQRCTALDVESGYCPAVGTRGPRSTGYDTEILRSQKIKMIEFGANEDDGVCSENCQYVDIGELDQLGGFVFLDGNADGFFNISTASADAPIANRVVELVASQVLVNPPLVSTTTSAQGVWVFDRAAALAVLPAGTSVFVRVLGGPARSVATTIPVFGNPNLANSFVDMAPFVGSGANPIRSATFAMPEINEPIMLRNAGYRPLAVEPPSPPGAPSECAPFAGPHATDAVFRVEAALEQCDTCNSTQLGPAPDAASCRAQCDAAQTGGLVFRRYAVRYKLVNGAPMAAEPAGVLEARLYTEPLGADDDDDTSLIVCAQPRFLADSVLTSGGAAPPTLLEERQAQSTGPLWLPPRVSVAYGAHPADVGAATEFVVEFDVCQARVPPAPTAPAGDFGALLPLNATARVLTDRCLEKERQWLTCAVDHDMRDCRSTLLFGGDGDTACSDAACALPPFGETPLPGVVLPPGVTLPPTPPPTPAIFGPPGANTLLQQAASFVHEDKFCVSDRRIDTFLCADKQTAYDACLAAEEQRTVVTARGVLFQLPGALTTSQRGTLTVELERLAPLASTRFCRRGFDPQVNVSSLALAGSGDIDHALPSARQLARVINSDVVDGGTLARVVVEFIGLAPGEAVLVQLSALECLAAADGTLEYRYTQRIQSETCTDPVACSISAHVGPTTATGNATALPVAAACVPLHSARELPFASCRSPGTVAHEAHENIVLGAPMGATLPPSAHALAPGILALIVVGSVGLCVVLVLLCCFLRGGARRRSGGGGSGGGGGRSKRCAAPPRRRTVRV